MHFLACNSVTLIYVHLELLHYCWKKSHNLTPQTCGRESKAIFTVKRCYKASKNEYYALLAAWLQAGMCNRFPHLLFWWILEGSYYMYVYSIRSTYIGFAIVLLFSCSLFARLFMCTVFHRKLIKSCRLLLALKIPLLFPFLLRLLLFLQFFGPEFLQHFVFSVFLLLLLILPFSLFFPLLFILLPLNTQKSKSSPKKTQLEFIKQSFLAVTRFLINPHWLSN